MKIKIILVLFGIFVLYGCSGLFRGKDYTPSITSKDVYSGKEGLKMEFFENAPPREIFENTVMPIGMRLYNMGAFDIKDGYLSVNLEKDYMELNDNSLKAINDRVNFQDPQHIVFELTGKSIEHPEGEFDVITFSASTRDLGVTDPQSELHKSLIAITACYGYQTKAVETVCVDTDVYGFKKREKACEVKTLTLDSQGAPVAVTRIEGEMLPDKDNPSLVKPRFLITVKNVGKGEVIKGDGRTIRDACSSEPLGKDKWNTINAKVYISDMDEKNKLDCDTTNEGGNDDGILVLKQKEDTIRCKYELGFEESKGTFATPIYIVLDYGYTNTISRDVTIKKVLTH